MWVGVSEVFGGGAGWDLAKWRCVCCIKGGAGWVQGGGRRDRSN